MLANHHDPEELACRESSEFEAGAAVAHGAKEMALSAVVSSIALRVKNMLAGACRKLVVTPARILTICRSA